MNKDTRSETLPPAGGSQVDRLVGRLEPEREKFRRGDLVRKRSGSAWEGRVCGEYSTALTPEGYAVESAAHPGSVQIYPAAALELVARGEPPNNKAELAPTAKEKHEH